MLKISGRLDTNTSEELRTYFSNIRDEFRSMVIDLKHLEYVSSSGLRQFLTFRKKVKNADNFHIINCSELVMGIFHATGFDEIMNVTLDEDDVELKNLSFTELLHKQVELHGDEIFIKDEFNEYSWRDIDNCAKILAKQLSKIGVQRNSHVGICSENSVNWLIAFFAIVRLGAIALLMNPGLTYNELVRLTDIGDISHICIGENKSGLNYNELSERLRSDEQCKARKFIDINKQIDLKKIYKESEQLDYPFVRMDKDDACVMIFSSGTTGRPKGVLLSAYNILNSADTIGKKLHISEDDVQCLVLPLFHIFGFMACVMSNALHNAKIIFPKDRKSETIIDTIYNNYCTIFNSVPTMMIAIVKNKYFDPEKLSTLRTTMLAGAPISETQLLNLMEQLPENNYVISYGLSEMAPVSMTEYEDSLGHLLNTVGKPVDGIEIRIYDPITHKDHAPGDDGYGEILVRGYNLMCAYYKRDINDQSIDEDDWLHTGDLGYIDDEGYLHLVGRSKELIIRGGENIIPNEVSAAICSNENVSDAKVIGVPDEFYGEVVASAIVLKDPAKWNEEEMKKFLTDKLAKYKVPVYYAIYDEFPLLSNGKVDMLSLKEDLVNLSKENKTA